MAKALRITGRIDVEALRRSLDDLVARHSILRSVVVHDAEPPYQEVFPAEPVPLDVHEVPPGTDRAQHCLDLLSEAELSALDVTELPLLRAGLHRFDDTDAVLTLVTHHTAADGVSMEILLRDLAAGYAARAGGREPALPHVPGYCDFAAWQQAGLSGEAAIAAVTYWREKLAGARIWTLPTDRPVREQHTSPYRAHCHVMTAQTMEAVNQLAIASRSSPFVVLLAVINMLACKITSTSDPVVTTMSAGRGHKPYRDTVGPFLNFIPMRTDLSACESYLDVIAATRATAFEGQARELPLSQVEQIAPDLMRSLEDPRNCDFTFGFWRPTVGTDAMRIADDMVNIHHSDQESVDIPGGATWTVGVTESGAAFGKVQYSPDEFDDSTVTGWVDLFQRLLTGALESPDRAWKNL